MPNIFQEISKRIVESITMLSDKKLQFRDSALYIQSSADGQLDVVADTTVALSGAVTADSTLVVTGATTLNGALASDGITLNSTAASGSATIAADVGFLSITGPGANERSILVLGTPSVGREFTATLASGAGTAYVTLTPGSTFDGTNGTAAFDGAGETLKLIGISTTRYAILENIGSVALDD